MKFGKTITASQWTPWHDVYIPYKKLKKVLKVAYHDPARFADMEGMFVTQLLKSVRAVDEFFVGQEGFLAERLDALRTACNEPVAEELVTVALSRVSHDIGLVCAGVNWLRNYATLNQEAVRKILKKHDKLSAIAFGPALSAHVEERSFSSMARLESILGEAQLLLDTLFANRPPVAVNAPADEQPAHLTGLGDPRELSTSSSPLGSPHLGGPRLWGPPPSLIRRLDSFEAKGPADASAAGGNCTDYSVVDSVAEGGIPLATDGAASDPCMGGEGGGEGGGMDGSSSSLGRRQACVECHRAKSACQGYPCSRCVRLGKACVMREKRKRSVHPSSNLRPWREFEPGAWGLVDLARSMDPLDEPCWRAGVRIPGRPTRAPYHPDWDGTALGPSSHLAPPGFTPHPPLVSHLD